LPYRNSTEAWRRGEISIGWFGKSTDFVLAYRPVVDALLKHADDEVAHSAEVKLKAARASFRRQYGNAADELLEVVRKLVPHQATFARPVRRWIGAARK
jgi:hypothetical protein